MFQSGLMGNGPFVLIKILQIYWVNFGPKYLVLHSKLLALARLTYYYLNLYLYLYLNICIMTKYTKNKQFITWDTMSLDLFSWSWSI